MYKVLICFILIDIDRIIQTGGDLEWNVKVPYSVARGTYNSAIEGINSFYMPQHQFNLYLF